MNWGGFCLGLVAKFHGRWRSSHVCPVLRERKALPRGSNKIIRMLCRIFIHTVSLTPSALSFVCRFDVYESTISLCTYACLLGVGYWFAFWFLNLLSWSFIPRWTPKKKHSHDFLYDDIRLMRTETTWSISGLRLPNWSCTSNNNGSAWILCNSVNKFKLWIYSTNWRRSV